MKLQEIKLLEGKFVLPITSRNIDKHRAKWLNRGLENLAKFIKEKELNATEFKSLKSDINNAFEDSYSKFIRANYFHAGKWESLPGDLKYDLDLSPAAHKINSMKKKIVAAKKKYDHPLITDTEKLVSEWEPVAVAINSLKNMIVKTKRAVIAKKESEASTNKRLLSHKDVKKVQKVLEDVTVQVRTEVQKANEGWIMSYIDSWKAQYKEGERKTMAGVFFRNNPQARTVVSDALDTDFRKQSETLKKGYKKTVVKNAKKMTDDLLMHFISKNTGKLASIVAGKDNLKTVKLQSYDTSRGVVEGILALVFKDKSSFTVTNKVIMSFSKYGKPFYKYPTTFHNIKLSDGSKMPRPSEERMNTEFLK